MNADVVCPDCGHGRYFHRANLVVGNTRVGEPVPCWRKLPDGSWCDCTRRPKPIGVAA